MALTSNPKLFSPYVLNSIYAWFLLSSTFNDNCKNEMAKGEWLLNSVKVKH